MRWISPKTKPPPEMSDTNGSKKRHVAHRREIRFFRAMFLTSVLSQTEGGDSIHRIFKRLLSFLSLRNKLLFEYSRDKIFLNPEEKSGKINFLGIFEKSYTAKICKSLDLMRIFILSIRKKILHPEKRTQNFTF